MGFEGSFGSKHVSPRTLNTRNLGNLVCVEGIVTKCKGVYFPFCYWCSYSFIFLFLFHWIHCHFFFFSLLFILSLFFNLFFFLPISPTCISLLLLLFYYLIERISMLVVSTFTVMYSKSICLCSLERQIDLQNFLSFIFSKIVDFHSNLFHLPEYMFVVYWPLLKTSPYCCSI